MFLRRRFLQVTAVSALAAGAISQEGRSSSATEKSPQQLDAELTQILSKPVLRLDHVKEKVTIASIELLREGNAFLLRTRSKSGLEVITVPHQAKIGTLYPILLKSIVPVFIGRDARELETLLWEVYRHADNYKMQGLAFWVCVAAVEMGLLELMSQAAGKPLADLFGGARKRDIGVYFASGNRGNMPEEEITYLQSLVADSGARALKFRLGGRMSRNADSLPGRSESLIALARKTFGDDYVGRRVGLRRSCTLCIVRSKLWPLHGIQRQFKFASTLRKFFTSSRAGHGAMSDRNRFWCDHRPGVCGTRKAGYRIGCGCSNVGIPFATASTSSGSTLKKANKSFS